MSTKARMLDKTEIIRANLNERASADPVAAAIRANLQQPIPETPVKAPVLVEKQNPQLFNRLTRTAKLDRSIKSPSEIFGTRFVDEEDIV